MNSRLVAYQFKIYFKQKMNLMWNFLFPIALMSLIILSILPLTTGKNLKLAPVNVLIVEDESGSEETLTTEGGNSFSSLTAYLDMAGGKEKSLYEKEKREADEKTETEKEAEEPIVIYRTGSKEEGEKLLSEGSIYAVVFDGKDLNYIAAQKSEVVAPLVLDEILMGYKQSRQAVSSIKEAYVSGEIPIPKQNPEQIAERFKNFVPRKISKEGRSGGINPDKVVLFVVIAYVAFFPVNAGLDAMMQTQACLSGTAVRNAVSPYNKSLMFIISLLPRLFFHLVITSLSFAYSMVLGLTYAGLAYSLLPLLMVTLCAIFFGTAIGGIFGNKKGLVVGLSISIPLIFAFTSGMNGPELKNYFDGAVPFLGKINPVRLASGALYYLANDAGKERYWETIVKIALILAALVIITLLSLRRKNYESL